MADFLLRIGDPNYPKSLLDLNNPPQKLYCRGNLELLRKPAVAIVGTRNCTRYGVICGQNISKCAVENGFAVVSGLAGGIDTSAHKGGIEATIAVLGNGLDVYYPISNKNLQEQIGREGLLITEYPNNFHAENWTFPARNRIVAALSNAVIAVEADIRSGTMITVEIAAEIHRDIYAVPGSILSNASRGTNKLIRDNKAKIFDDADAFFGGHIKKKTKQIEPFTFDEQKIIDVLQSDEVHFDELVEKTDFGVAVLSNLLTTMELKDLIEKLPGNLYVLK